MKIIAISGKAQHGKDTTARIIKEKLEEDGCNVLVIHYADLLKHICRSFFGWNGRKDDAGRHLLQYVGTDIVRAKRPNFWVDFVIDVLSLFPDEWDYVLIPDSRFPNEITRLKEVGLDCIHIRVTRQNFASPLTKEQQSHPSETALDGTVADYTIHNDGDLDDLKIKVTRMLEDMVYGCD